MTLLPRNAGRRRVLVVMAGAAVAARSFAATTPAQASQTATDWLALIKQQHEQIERAFDNLLRGHGPRDASLRTLDQLLNAHQMAEENVLYPAIARAGQADQADHLYLEEAHAKIMLAQVQLASAGSDWMDTARQLQKAVLQHAHEDEERKAYPQLKERLDPAQDRLLSTQYSQQFARVMPTRT